MVGLDGGTQGPSWSIYILDPTKVPFLGHPNVACQHEGRTVHITVGSQYNEYIKIANRDPMHPVLHFCYRLLSEILMYCTNSDLVNETTGTQQSIIKT